MVFYPFRDGLVGRAHPWPIFAPFGHLLYAICLSSSSYRFSVMKRIWSPEWWTDRAPQAEGSWWSLQILSCVSYASTPVKHGHLLRGIVAGFECWGPRLRCIIRAPLYHRMTNLGVSQAQGGDDQAVGHVRMIPDRRKPGPPDESRTKSQVSTVAVRHVLQTQRCSTITRAGALAEACRGVG